MIWGERNETRINARLVKSGRYRVFHKHWGSPDMVNSHGTFRCDELEGFAVTDDKGDIKGLITYFIAGNECEVVSLDSIAENKGIGSLLLNEVERAAKRKQCQSIKLITTNDNMRALCFIKREAIQWPSCM